MLLAGLVGSVISAVAQEERPQIMPGERKAPRKKDAGPRALGIIQLGKNGKASIIPVAILINGKFWDASAYKADPVPMALDSGVVYEGERSGSSLGLFTVGSALHSNNPNAAMPWLGTGVWRVNGTEPPPTAKKAEATPAGMSGDEAPPRLTRDVNANKPVAPASTNAPTSQPSQPSSGSGDGPPRLTKGDSSPGSDSSQQSTPAPAPSSSSPPPAQPGSDSGDGPPRLNRGSASSGSDSSSSQKAPDPSANGQSKPSESKPGDSKTDSTSSSKTKPADQEKDKSSSVATSDSGAGEANRPRLRRGRPAESFADEEIPGYSLPGVRPKSQDAGKVVQAAAANKEDVQLIPAISDAADTSGIDPRSFVFEWIPGEEADRRKQMVEMAKEQVKKYIETRSKNSISANETPAKPAKKPVSSKAAMPELENMQMVSYDLWGSNQPVLVLSAQSHAPASASVTQTDSDLQYSVVVVAYPDIYHNLHKLFVSITDKFHLDMTPRLELIDAVDVDGDGRGELLFRETSDQGSGWVVYRVGADKLAKAFDSLNPE